MIRGFTTVVKIRPNDAAFTCRFGLAKLAWFSALNASARNSSR